MTSSESGHADPQEPGEPHENVEVDSTRTEVSDSQSENSLNLAAPQAPGASKTSFLGRATNVLNDVAKQASAVSRPIADKAAQIGKSSVSKGSQVGKQAYAAAGDVARQAIQVGTDAYSGSKLESAVQYLDQELDQRGAKQAARETKQVVVGKLDQVTGKRLLELLEEKLRVQDAYNDVLATRLAEALERIAALEVEVAALRAQSPRVE